MSEQLLKVLIKKYPNNFELGSIIRSYSAFYDLNKNKYAEDKLDKMFIKEVISDNKAFKL